MDGLLLLRSALTQSQTIHLLAFPTTAVPPFDSPSEDVFSLELCTHISFPSGSNSPKIILPKSTATRYRTEPNGDAVYDLQTLLFAALQKDTALGTYMREAASVGTNFVSVTQRRMVTDWLYGKTAIEGAEGMIKPLKRDVMEVDSISGTGRSSEIIPENLGASPSKKMRYIVNKEDQEKVARLTSIIDGPIYGTVMGEGRPDKAGSAYRNRETVLRGDRINNFDSVRNLAAARIRISRDEVNAQTSSTPAQSRSEPSKLKKKQLTPIILISPSSTSLITMYNVKKFLEDSMFEPSDVARDTVLPGDISSSANVANDLIQINHARTTTSISSTISGKSSAGEIRKARYFVVDSIEALNKFGGVDEAWERVVCVMTTGQEWQFKPYKWPEPKELFHHVKGVFVQWTNDAPNPKVRSWNVTELRIDPSKRHIDKSTVADFWRTLEAWISMNKPWLSY